MAAYYEQSSHLSNEKKLSDCIDAFHMSSTECLVQFLHVILNNLFSLLVRQTTNEESHSLSAKAFQAIVAIVHRISSLDLPKDKHGRNHTLATYVQYVFDAPWGTGTESLEMETPERKGNINRKSRILFLV